MEVQIFIQIVLKQRYFMPKCLEAAAYVSLGYKIMVFKMFLFHLQPEKNKLGPISAVFGCLHNNSNNSLYRWLKGRTASAAILLKSQNPWVFTDLDLAIHLSLKTDNCKYFTAAKNLDECDAL